MPTAGVPRRGCCEEEPVHLDLIPPVHLSDTILADAPVSKMRRDAQRRDENRGRRRQGLDRGLIEVVVVIVRDEDHVDLTERLQRDRRTIETTRPRPGERAHPRAPDRIRQHPETIELDQYGRVPHPGDARRIGRPPERRLGPLVLHRFRVQGVHGLAELCRALGHLGFQRLVQAFQLARALDRSRGQGGVEGSVAVLQRVEAFQLRRDVHLAADVVGKPAIRVAYRG